MLHRSLFIKYFADYPFLFSWTVMVNTQKEKERGKGPLYVICANMSSFVFNGRKNEN